MVYCPQCASFKSVKDMDNKSQECIVAGNNLRAFLNVPCKQISMPQMFSPKKAKRAKLELEESSITC
jgi:ATP sulfurylase